MLISTDRLELVIWEERQTYLTGVSKKQIWVFIRWSRSCRGNVTSCGGGCCHGVLTSLEFVRAALCVVRAPCKSCKRRWSSRTSLTGERYKYNERLLVLVRMNMHALPDTLDKHAHPAHSVLDAAGYSQQRHYMNKNVNPADFLPFRPAFCITIAMFSLAQQKPMLFRDKRLCLLRWNEHFWFG